MNRPKDPQRPEDRDQDKENQNDDGGETFGNEPEIKDPKKPRSPDKYEMNSL